MENNLDKVAKDLYGKIKTRFNNIKMGDENANVLSKKADIPNARFFEFQYEEHGVPLGTITISIDDEDGIVVQLSGDLGEFKSSHSLNKFIKSFRQFAKTRMLNFDVQNIGKSNLDKRDYQFQAKPKELPIMESKMFGTSRISYQNLGETRLIIKHSQDIDPTIAGSRSMHIKGIFIENQEGERFKYPFKHLSGARALAEHIGNGGTPYDGIGKHITGLSEELTQLRKFKNYVNRQPQLSESIGTITSKVMERIEEVKKEIQMLQRPTYYKQFVESFQEREDTIIPEDILNDWVDRLTVRTFNEELTTVFPYLYNILDESELPIRELSAEDLLTINTDTTSIVKKHNSIRHEDLLSHVLESIVTEDKNELFSPNPGAQNKAIERFNQILANELTGGPAGVLALKGIIDEPKLIDKIQVLHTDAEIRSEIKDYILDKNPKLIPLLPKLDELNPSPMGGEEPAPAPMAAPVPEVPPAPEATPPASPAPGAVPPAPEATPPVPGEVPPAPMAESVDECAMNPGSCGDNDELNYDESGVQQLLKLISGFWNKEKRNFTIGGERAKIKVVKAFKDGESPNASEDDVKQVLMFIDKLDPTTEVPTEPTDEIEQDTREHDLLRNVHVMQEQPYMESEISRIIRNAGIK